MTKFEQKGIIFQYEADSKKSALDAFKYSCDCCCTKGMKIECDRCAIATVHSLVIAYFDDANKTQNL